MKNLILIMLVLFVSMGVVRATGQKDLMDVASDLGIDVSGVTLEYGTPDTNGMDDVAGSFFEGTITISSDKKFQPYLERIVAHEYAHYRFSQLDNEGVIEAIKRNAPVRRTAWMREKLSGYSCDGTCLAAESEAYACTEMPQHLISDEFKKYCEEFIPNRQLLF